MPFDKLRANDYLQHNSGGLRRALFLPIIQLTNTDQFATGAEGNFKNTIHPLLRHEFLQQIGRKLHGASVKVAGENVFGGALVVLQVFVRREANRHEHFLQLGHF